MAETKIEWCDKVWNPVTGCTKVSQGCKHCYAERIFSRELPAMKGQKFTEVRCHEDRLAAPLHWRKPQRVFVNSMSDLFHERVSDKFIARVFSVMADAQQHTFMVLTKRAERMRKLLADIAEGGWVPDVANGTWYAAGRRKFWDWPLPNLWLGVSVEDQKAADGRIPLLLQTPAAVRFLSVEPLLGPVNLHRWFDVVPAGMPRIFPLAHTAGMSTPQLDWVICGGESGPNARPMHPDWARSLRDQCQAAGVPFFFKQWGEFSSDERSSNGEWVRRDGGMIKPPLAPNEAQFVFRVGKKSAGRLLDGREWNEFPEVSRG